MGQSSKSFSQPRLDAARNFIRAWVKNFKNPTEAARRLGISQAHLSEVIADKPKRGVGPKLVESVADAAGVTLDEVVGRSVGRVVLDSIPERAAAIAFAIANGIPEPAIEKVKQLPARELTPEQWYNRIKVEAAELPHVGDPDAPPTAPPITLKRNRAS